jgi:hypothetical protein
MRFEAMAIWDARSDLTTKHFYARGNSDSREVKSISVVVQYASASLSWSRGKADDTGTYRRTQAAVWPENISKKILHRAGTAAAISLITVGQYVGNNRTTGGKDGS